MNPPHPILPSRAEQLRASPPMFASAWMDRFTRVHPAAVPALYVPVIVGCGALALRAGVAAGPLAAWILLGYLAWTFTEYWLHRCIFHLSPAGGLGARLHWMMHGIHHDHPNDPLRLVMPPGASLPLAAAFVGLFHLLLSPGAAWALGTGFLAGYLAYDMVHYAVHHRAPRGPVGRRLRELHLRHHFQDDTTGFGVSVPWLDVLFRTAPRSRRRHPQPPSPR